MDVFNRCYGDITMSKKEKKKTIAWDLIPNQYEYRIILVLSNERFDQICIKLNEKFNFGYIKDKDFKKNEPNPGPCVICNEDERICAIILDEFSNSLHNQCTLTHELMHVSTLISNNIGLKINEETTESWAYFMSFYYKVCMECLLEYVKDNK